MLKYLLLMRHAKSSWSSGATNDHDRPLSGRGKRSATAIGHALSGRNLDIDLIWSSDAVRTRQTCMYLLQGLSGTPVIDFIPSFYHTSAETVLSICKTQGEPTASSLMLVGHNPGWSDLHYHFTGQRHDMPTGMCTILSRRQHGNWLSASDWSMHDILLPRELLEE